MLTLTQRGGLHTLSFYLRKNHDLIISKEFPPIASCGCLKKHNIVKEIFFIFEVIGFPEIDNFFSTIGGKENRQTKLKISNTTSSF